MNFGRLFLFLDNNHQRCLNIWTILTVRISHKNVCLPLAIHHAGSARLQKTITDDFRSAGSGDQCVWGEKRIVDCGRRASLYGEHHGTHEGIFLDQYICKRICLVKGLNLSVKSAVELWGHVRPLMLLWKNVWILKGCICRGKMPWISWENVVSQFHLCTNVCLFSKACTFVGRMS